MDAIPITINIFKMLASNILPAPILGVFFIMETIEFANSGRDPTAT
ncbi:MAG: hypothetical protein NZ841_03350 [Dictyoglomus sp.]|nr:hypothetical protein [Dictyoglomus sp.]MDW8188315.1 hypothetical protein [Dictyoglomus sp.]